MLDLLAIDEGWYTTHEAMAQAWLRAGNVPSYGPEAAAKLVPVRRGSGSLAIIPVMGYLTQKPTLLSLLFGGTSVEALAADVVAAMGDSSITAVVLDVDSPGGSVHGVPEAAAKIRAARGLKPLIAVANPLAASASYWLASQADEVVATPSSLTGSIGVLAEHADLSGAMEKQGIKFSLVRYGRNKASAHPAVALGEDGLAELQGMVDTFGRMFDADVAKGRRVSVEKVRSDFGEGAVFTAERALAAGLVDRVETLDDVIRHAPRMAQAAARAYDGNELRLRAMLAGLDRR